MKIMDLQVIPFHVYWASRLQGGLGKTWRVQEHQDVHA